VFQIAYVRYLVERRVRKELPLRYFGVPSLGYRKSHSSIFTSVWLRSSRKFALLIAQGASSNGVNSILRLILKTFSERDLRLVGVVYLGACPVASRISGADSRDWICATGQQSEGSCLIGEDRNRIWTFGPVCRVRRSTACAATAPLDGRVLGRAAAFLAVRLRSFRSLKVFFKSR
jgi:hypothetical protein